MDTLLAAIRTRLQDGSLNETVAHNDITASYNPETANYPCIVLSIAGGGSGTEPWETTRATLRIDIYSRTNKQELWTAYNRVKVLLHTQELMVTTSTLKVVWIYESSVDDSVYNIESDAWHLVAFYEILYHTDEVIMYSAANGYIYADANDVKRTSTKIGYFRGGLSIRMVYDYVARSEQERFPKNYRYRNGQVIITFEEVVFDPSMLNLLWGVTLDASDTLADDSTAATSYTISQSTFPRYLQFLFRCTRSYDSKAMEIEADKAVCNEITIPLMKRDLALSNCVFHCLADANDNIIRVAIAN